MSISLDGVRIVRKRSRRNLILGICIAGAEIVLTFFLYMAISGHILFPDSTKAATGSPNLLSYEGFLTDSSGNPLGGTGTLYCFRFSIYNEASSGTKSWPSGSPATTSATTTDGVFAALVGQADTLDYNFYDNDTTFLNVEVNATPTTCGGAWQSMSPRQRIAASGYSISTENIYGALLQSITSSNRVQIGTGAGVVTPITLGLDVKSANTDFIGESCTTSGTVWYNSAISKALVCENSVIQAISNSSATTTISGITANAVAAASTGTIAFSNSNGITFGLNGNTITASASSVVFSNAAAQNITFGYNAGTLTASVAAPGGGAGATVSYFENHPWYQGAASTLMNVSGSSIWVAPFVLPVAVSASYIRIPVSMSHVQTTASHASTANASFSLARFQTNAAVIYSQGVGASSRSLQSVASGSVGWTLATTISHAAQSSQNTVHFNITYPREGGTSSYTTSYGQSSASYVLQSGSMTLFTGPRWLDIPFATSLAAGNYWLALGRSTTTSTQNTIANASTALFLGSVGFSTVGISQGASSVGLMGLATNSSIQFQPGLGWWTTNAFVLTTASMGINSISAIVSNPKPYFQMIRQS